MKKIVVGLILAVLLPGCTTSYYAGRMDRLQSRFDDGKISPDEYSEKYAKLVKKWETAFERADEQSEPSQWHQFWLGLAAGLAGAGSSVNQSPVYYTPPSVVYHSLPIKIPNITDSDKILGAVNVNHYDPNSMQNPYGAGSPYKADGLMNPYSEYGSKYSDESWNNPYATDPPKLYDSEGNYRGTLSNNPYDPDSILNPYSPYANEYVNPYDPIYVVKPDK